MLIPAIHFPGTCAKAISFYQKVFHAEVLSIAYNRDAPPDAGITLTEETRDFVMHAELRIAESQINMCDTTEKAAPGNMVLFNLFLDTAAEVTAVYQRLADGGNIITPLGPQFWTPMYCDVIDTFGIHWQLMAKQL